ncbi:MAG: IS3 family transposase, partial [Candidatus Yonathbacteria bacterium]|nr:IS3 family transposase [Candidatus Yonathbacteria bacterium]MBI5400511.1 IS3 family transposase [Candidatus Yonathbacteria bacterium]MBI5400524.1 IS3 family transposase [Candidatus Yonathbacteria bacterium]MBI5400536.1 IS3 family transposase [Candidatus Yonathbacteria bacterium]MBI5400599.1 IS3 family transposase [Candidatus Yonathbacteria bacterium]
IEEYMRYYNQERKQWEKKKMTPVEYRNHLLAHV